MIFFFNLDLGLLLLSYVVFILDGSVSFFSFLSHFEDTPPNYSISNFFTRFLKKCIERTK